jgi:hypothetical protein
MSALLYRYEFLTTQYLAASSVQVRDNPQHPPLSAVTF